MPRTLPEPESHSSSPSHGEYNQPDPRNLELGVGSTASSSEKMPRKRLGQRGSGGDAVLEGLRVATDASTTRMSIRTTGRQRSALCLKVPSMITSSNRVRPLAENG